MQSHSIAIRRWREALAHTWPQVLRAVTYGINGTQQRPGSAAGAPDPAPWTLFVLAGLTYGRRTDRDAIQTTRTCTRTAVDTGQATRWEGRTVSPHKGGLRGAGGACRRSRPRLLNRLPRPLRLLSFFGTLYFRD